MPRWIVFDEHTAAALSSRRIDAELHTGNALQSALEFGGGSVVLLPANNSETLVLIVTSGEASQPTGNGVLGLHR